MRIRIIHPCKGLYGGAEEVVVRLCEYFRKHGVAHEAILKDAPNAMLVDMQGTSVINRSNWLHVWLDAQLRCEDTVACLFNFPATLTIFPRRIRAVWYCNEPPELFTSIWRKPIEALNRWWVKYANMQVVVATPHDQQRFEHIYHYESALIAYGINFSFWSKLPRPPPTSTLRLLQVGTITQLKNQLFSLEVLSKLVDDLGIDAILTLVGAAPDKTYQRRLDKLAKAWNLEGRVTYSGQRNREEVRTLYSVHDVLLHPVLGQGGWLAPLEAACANLPTITVPDFQLSSELSYIARSPTEAAYLALEARGKDVSGELYEFIQKGLTWNRFGNELLSLLKLRGST